MKYPTSYLATLLIIAMVFLNTSSIFAQEWHVLLGHGVVQDTQSLKSSSTEKKDWLATQTPLQKNSPIADVGPNPRPLDGLLFDSEFTRASSWSPHPPTTGQEGFTLFSF